MRNLVLTGFMGTGKTSVARLVAARYGLDWVDVDAEVERRAGRSVAEIFADRGEEEFRRLESRAWMDIMSISGRVVATGGGTLLTEANLRLLQPDDMVLCLTADVGDVQSRLGGALDRPLLAPPGALARLLDQRREQYARFDQLDTSGLDVETVAARVANHAGVHQLDPMRVDLSRTCVVYFGHGAVERVGPHMATLGARGAALLVTDSTVAVLEVCDAVQRSLSDAGLAVAVLVLPPGEACKSLATLEQIYARCLDMELDRQGAIVAIGGGVVSDLAGFAASTYLRGVRLAYVPTTLLAQVDASIGGKVGVDFMGTKNLIGSFYPADLIAIDPACLITLPLSLLRDGLVEIIKIAYVQAAELVEQIDTVCAPEQILDRRQIVRRAVAEKLEVVAADPLERGDRRALLNFGHTVGHALESASGYRLSHGQAVAAGMLAESRLAVRLGLCPPEVQNRLQATLIRLGPTSARLDLDPETVLQYVSRDKKRRGAMSRMALPVGLGEGVVVEIAAGDVQSAVLDALEFAA